MGENPDLATTMAYQSGASALMSPWPPSGSSRLPWTCIWVSGLLLLNPFVIAPPPPPPLDLLLCIRGPVCLSVCPNFFAFLGSEKSGGGGGGASRPNMNKIGPSPSPSWPIFPIITNPPLPPPPPPPPPSCPLGSSYSFLFFILLL